MNFNINHVSETALLMVQCHAQDALSDKSILADQSSLMIMNKIRDEVADSTHKLHRVLQKKKIDKYLMLYIVLRAKQYDQYITDYILKYPDATIVNIGCGLDGRFERIDNGQITFYDLDLPDIIDIKRSFFKESDRYRYISQSMFDMDWMDQVSKERVLFVAEGVFMYFGERQVKSLFLELVRKFPDSEMVCELYNKRYLKPVLKQLGTLGQRLKYGMGEDASFKFGVQGGRDICSWSNGIELLSEWSYLDSMHPKLGLLKLFKYSDVFRKFVWTAHYRFNYR